MGSHLYPLWCSQRFRWYGCYVSHFGMCQMNSANRQSFLPWYASLADHVTSPLTRTRFRGSCFPPWSASHLIEMVYQARVDFAKRSLVRRKPYFECFLRIGSCWNVSPTLTSVTMLNLSLSNMQGSLGHPAWRWLFWIEGAVTMGVAISGKSLVAFQKVASSPL
jgi:hypothetical protein